MNNRPIEAYLIATPLGDDCVEIVAHTPEISGHNGTTIIFAGESFGGRNFEEWHAVGLTKGVIPAEWLQV
jgi:hypothetical protein